MKSIITFFILLTAPLLVSGAPRSETDLANNTYDFVDVSITGYNSSELSIELIIDKSKLSSNSEDTADQSITRWIAVPQGANITAELTSDYNNNNKTAINTGEGWTVGNISFVPLSINPNLLQASNDRNAVITTSLKINFLGGSPDDVSLSGLQRKMFGNLLLNNHLPRRDDVEVQQSSRYIYVVPDENRVSEAMEPLYELRKLEGFSISELRPYAWEDANDILRRIIELHEAGPPVEYVCLVGDVGGEYSIPAFIDGSSDYPYGLLEGEDPLPEAAVGRISYNSIAELERIVNKILTYQLEPDLNNTDWLSKAAVASGSEQSGFSTILVNRWVRDLLLQNDYTEVDTFWYTMGNTVEDFMSEAFEDGISFLSYRGYTGLENWTPQEASRFDNEFLPVALLLACNSGDYDGRGAGMTEALLRADGGAIGAIGTVGSQSRVPYNNALCSGFFRGVIEDDVCRLGWALNCAKLELFSAYDVVDMDRVSGHANWTILMGDPGTVIWLGEPREVVIDAPNRVGDGDGVFTVNVTSVQGDPLSDVRVGLFKLDDISLASYTDDDGNAEFHINHEAVGEGIATLTASGDRVLVTSVEIDFFTSPHILEYVDYSIIEDGEAPHMGNGDNVLNPNETVTISALIINSGAMVIDQQINFRLSSPSNAVEIVDDEYLHQEQLSPDSTVLVNFLVRLTSSFPDSQNVPLNINAVIGIEEWDIAFEIIGIAPRLEIAFTWIDLPLAPGVWTDFSVTFVNNSSMDIGPFVATLSSPSEFVTIIDGEALYDTLEVDSVGEPDLAFSMELDIDYPYDLPIPFNIDYTSEDDYSGTVEFTLQMPETPLTAPTGPDAYGYWAIDDSDASNIRPDFNWIEINPRWGGSGADLNLLDQGEDDDKSKVIELPFEFQYYGKQYDKLTICTNGWAAFGDQAQYVDFRNLAIGSPQGPRAQLCPWWDDLYQSGNEGDVFYYFDAELHRFIVEWYKMKRWIGIGGPGASETFQLILLDPDWYPSYTGDGDIIYQYHTVTNERRIHTPNGTPYATIGIGDPEDRDGLEYSFWNSYPPGARPVESAMSIRFSTSKRHEYALIKGQVWDEANIRPLTGATAKVSPGGSAVSDDMGVFRIPNALAEKQLTLTVSAPGYNTRIIQVEAVAVGDSSEVIEVGLLQPQIDININQVIDTLENDDEVEYRFEINNQGDGELVYEIYFDFPEEDGFNFERHPRRDDSDEMWESLLSIEASEATDDNRILGVAFADGVFFVSGGNNGEDVNYIYRFADDGRYINRFEQPCRNLWGLHDLAWDGEFLYGGCDDIIYVMETDGNVVNEIQSPLNPPRGLAVDPATGSIFIANNGDPIQMIDAEGELLESFTHRLRPYGLAWYEDDPDDHPLYIFSADGGTNLAINKLNPEDGSIRGVAILELEEADRAGGCEFTSYWDGIYWSFITVIQNPAGDRIEVFNGGLNTSWLTVISDHATVRAGRSREHLLRVQTANLISGEHNLDMIIDHNALGDKLRVPISVVYRDWLADGEGFTPGVFSLQGVYPNPSNGAAQAVFHLPSPVDVQFSIWDQSGRIVSDLIVEKYPAGTHRLVIPAENLPSGIYFIRMSAFDKNYYQKFVLIK